MKTVLLIDDEYNLKLVLADWLRLEGFEPILAEDGFQGVQMAKQYQPDLILCDVNMPLIDGFEVLRQVRNDLDTAHISFFFYTAESDLECRGVKQMGADGFISKSVELNVLRRIITTGSSR